MNRDDMNKLAEPFPPNAIGKLPKLTCSDCKENRWKVCDKHTKVNCPHCGNYISERHVDLDYVGHAWVTDRLNEVDAEWDWEPMALDQHGLPLVKDGELWIRLTVCGVTKLGVGDAPGKRNATKELIGDAIRNAAMRFGVALDLWKKDLGHAGDSEVAADGPQVPANRTGSRPAKKAAAKKAASAPAKAASSPAAAGKAKTLAEIRAEIRAGITGLKNPMHRRANITAFKKAFGEVDDLKVADVAKARAFVAAAVAGDKPATEPVPPPAGVADSSDADRLARVEETSREAAEQIVAALEPEEIEVALAAMELEIPVHLEDAKILLVERLAEDFVQQYPEGITAEEIEAWIDPPGE